MDKLNLEQKRQAIIQLLEHQVDTPLAGMTRDAEGNYSVMDPTFTDDRYKILAKDINDSDDIDIATITTAEDNPDFKTVYELFKQEGYDLGKYKYIAAIRRARSPESRSDHPDIVYVLLD